MSADSQETKRQARGRARIDLILLAAAETFGDLGYESATTNAIAARAGISPGSLYQFFKNKEDIANALSERYAEQLSGVELGTGGVEPATLESAVHAAIVPIVEFNRANPGYKALFARTDMPASMREAVAPVRENLHGRIRAGVARLLPQLDDGDLERTVLVVMHMVQGLMPLIVAAPDAERAALMRELERSLVAYLQSVAEG
jgi:AcrR family transcriptional regulator